MTSEESSPAMKRRRTISLSIKSTILDRLAAGQSNTRIAMDLKLAESVVRRIGKQQATIRAAVATLGEEGARGTLRQRNLRLYKMEACLLTWLEDMRVKRLPVWCSKICTKAVQIYEEIGDLGYEDSVEFLASFGWFTRFRKKCGLAEVRPQPDRVPVSEGEFLTSFKNTIRDGKYSRKQIFMAERTTFWWKRFPGLPEEDSVSLVLCCNASGDYISIYKPEAEDDMTCSFLTWFVEQFIPETASYLQANELPNKPLLVVASDQGCPQDLYENHIKTVIIPPDCHSSLLPAVLGILQHLNAVYLKNLSEYLVLEVENDKPLEQVWNNFTLDQALPLLTSCIPQLHKSTLTIAWIKLLQDLPGRFCNEQILRQIAANAAILKIPHVTVNQVLKLITPAELTAEEVIELFHKRQLEREVHNPPPPPTLPEVKQEPVDHTLIPEIDRHLAALAAARAFFETHDQNVLRQEAISKRLEQVCGWAAEMRSELVEQTGEVGADADASVSCEPFEEITIKEEPLGLD